MSRGWDAAALREGTHHTQPVLGKSNELLVSGGTDIQPNGQQPPQRSHDEGGLHGVAVSFPPHLLPLLVGHSGLQTDGCWGQALLRSGPGPIRAPLPLSLMVTMF